MGGVIAGLRLEKDGREKLGVVRSGPGTFAPGTTHLWGAGRLGNRLGQDEERSALVGAVEGGRGE